MSIFINPKAEKRKGRKKAFFRSWDSLPCSLQGCHLSLAGINIINSLTVSNIYLEYAESQTIKDLCYFVWEPPLLKQLVTIMCPLIASILFSSIITFYLPLCSTNLNLWLNSGYHIITMQFFSYSYCNFKNIFMPICSGIKWLQKHREWGVGQDVSTLKHKIAIVPTAI